MKTLTKRKSLMGFIYALVMLLPFSAILVRCLYVTFNKNAYQSYSDYTTITYINAQSTQQIVGQVYQVRYNPSGTVGTYQYLEVLDGKTNVNDLFLQSPQKEKTITRLTVESNGQTLYCFFSDNTYYGVNNWYQISYNFNYTASSTSTIDTTNRYYNVFSINYVEGKLDNAFDYSLYTFLNENGTGQLNLTDWFTDIFLSRTTHNMLYLNYVNWYMNYSLLVSCVYLLYSVLMWFLTFARYIINKPLKEEE